MDPTQAIADAARMLRADPAFESVTAEGSQLRCRVRGSAPNMHYAATAEGAGVWISMATTDRWLSQSIEADLMHTGDALEELLAEELANLDCEVAVPKFEHFRSPQLEYTFRINLSPKLLSGSNGPARIATFVRAFAGCFAELGDVMGEDED